MYSVPEHHKLGLFCDAGMLRRVACRVRGRRHSQRLSLKDFFKEVLGYRTCSTSPVDGVWVPQHLPEVIYINMLARPHTGDSLNCAQTRVSLLFFPSNKERALSPFVSFMKVYFGARRATPHADGTGDRVW